MMSRMVRGARLLPRRQWPAAMGGQLLPAHMRAQKPQHVSCLQRCCSTTTAGAAEAFAGAGAGAGAGVREAVEAAAEQLRAAARAVVGGELDRAEGLLDAASSQLEQAVNPGVGGGDGAGGGAPACSDGDGGGGSARAVAIPPWLEWPLHSSRAALALGRGDGSGARAACAEALNAAMAASKLGLGDDSFVDIGGCLIDLAAAELVGNGDGVEDPAAVAAVQSAERHVRRAQYMLGRAYRPPQALQRDAILCAAPCTAQPHLTHRCGLVCCLGLLFHSSS